MKIKLTDEQIDQLVQNEEQKLQASFNGQVEKMKQQLEKDVLALRKKFEHFEINVQDAEPKKKGSFNEEQFIIMVNEGKKSSEIAEIMGITAGYASIKKGQLIKANKLKAKK